MITAEIVEKAGKRLDAARLFPGQTWYGTPAMADLIGITRDMVDKDGRVVLPNGNVVVIPDWAEEDGA